jgi:hypothetical protein
LICAKTFGQPAASRPENRGAAGLAVLRKESALKALRRYRHYNLDSAEAERKEGLGKKYRITTINWTFATERGQTNRQRVHKNEYVYTLRGLIQFIRGTQDVAEDIIAIEPLGNEES